MTISLTEENYLKAIYFISGPSQVIVSTNAIAERLDTKAATVTDMLRKLKQKNLIEYTPYKGSKLSDEGRIHAVSVLRKHRLWETFLVEKLGFGWEEVHEIAEQLEHVRSPKLTERLFEYLGEPRFDPHGDPIPDKAGIFPERTEMTLDKAKSGDQVVVIGVKDSSKDFLTYVAKLGVQLGHQLEVISVESFDQSMLLAHQGQEWRLSAQATANLYIQVL